MDGVINSITLYTVESGMITGYVQVWPTSGNGGHLRHWHRIAAAVSLIAVRYSRSILFHVCSDMSPRSGSRCLTIWFGWQFTLQSASVSWLSYNDDTSTDVSSSFSLRQCLARDVSLLSLRSTCAKWWPYFIIDSMLAECYVAALKDLPISLNAHCLSCFPTMGPTWTHEGHSPYVYPLVSSSQHNGLSSHPCIWSSFHFLAVTRWYNRSVKQSAYRNIGTTALCLMAHDPHRCRCRSASRKPLNVKSMVCLPSNYPLSTRRMKLSNRMIQGVQVNLILSNLFEVSIYYLCMTTGIAP